MKSRCSYSPVGLILFFVFVISSSVSFSGDSRSNSSGILKDFDKSQMQFSMEEVCDQILSQAVIDRDFSRLNDLVFNDDSSQIQRTNCGWFACYDSSSVSFVDRGNSQDAADRSFIAACRWIYSRKHKDQSPSNHDILGSVILKDVTGYEIETVSHDDVVYYRASIGGKVKIFTPESQKLQQHLNDAYMEAAVWVFEQHKKRPDTLIDHVTSWMFEK